MSYLTGSPLQEKLPFVIETPVLCLPNSKPNTITEMVSSRPSRIEKCLHDGTHGHPRFIMGRPFSTGSLAPGTAKRRIGTWSGHRSRWNYVFSFLCCVGFRGGVAKQHRAQIWMLKHKNTAGASVGRIGPAVSAQSPVSWHTPLVSGKWPYFRRQLTIISVTPSNSKHSPATSIAGPYHEELRCVGIDAWKTTLKQLMDNIFHYILLKIVVNMV